MSSVATDDASYTENVRKLLQICRESGSQQSMKDLFLLTFHGRRKYILANKFKNVSDILKTSCPLLNQEKYMSIF
jgi:hypothetical protein